MLESIVVVAAMCLLGTCELQSREPPRDPELEYPEYACKADDLVVSRSDYHEKLQGFWLGECIANWTGLRTEGLKKTAPCFTDKDWGTNQGRDNQKIESWFDAGINFGASLISLFYGEGDFRRTVQIGSLCGWDSDNPTATWGGLLGFMLGREGVEAAFPEKNLSGLYHIARTRINFPDRTPDQPGDDTFELMAERGVHVIDRVVIEEMGGGVDLEKNVWCIPGSDAGVQRASSTLSEGGSS